MYGSIYHFGINAEYDITNHGDINIDSKLLPSTLHSHELPSISGVGLGSYRGIITNYGNISISSTPGEISSATNIHHATGIKAQSDVLNKGNIIINTSGENSFVDSSFFSQGIRSYGTVTNTGNITISTIAGGTNSTESWGLRSNSEAYGIFSTKNTINHGTLSVTTAGGNNSNGGSSSSSTGILSQAEVENHGEITVSATGGDDSSDDAIATSHGIQTYGRSTVNHGNITATSRAGKNATDRGEAVAQGIHNHSSYITTNYGNIEVSSFGGDYANTAFSTTADGIYSDGEVINEGSISVTLQSGNFVTEQSDIYANGIYSLETITNTGKILLKATGGDYIGTSANLYADGIDNHQGNVTNHGEILMNTKGGDYFGGNSQQNITVGINSSSSVINSNTISIEALGSDYATHSTQLAAVGISSKNDVLNQGIIAITGLGGNANQDSSGGNSRIDVTGISRISRFSNFGDSSGGFFNDSNISNYGDIQLRSLGGSNISGLSQSWVTGIDTYSSGNGIIENHGSIDIIAIGGDESRDINGLASSTNGAETNAIGISSNGEINNYGDIIIDACSGYNNFYNSDVATYGIVSYRGTNNKVFNAGKLIVSGHAGTYIDSDSTLNSSDAVAIGIYMNGGGEIHSSGLIDVSVNRARDNNNQDIGGGILNTYQIYGDGWNNEVTVTGFAMEFGDSQEALNTRYESSLGVATQKGSKIAFSEDATLYVYTNNHIHNGENTYTIPALIESDKQNNVKKGYFSNLQIETTSPEYILARLSEKNDSELQNISITYDPQTSSPLLAASVNNVITGQGTRIVKSTITNSIISHMLASDPTTIEYDGILLASNTNPQDTSSVVFGNHRKKNSIFIQPYFTDTSNSSTPMGYEADIKGISGGYNYHVNNRLVIGAHAGYGKADIDFTGRGYDQRSENIDTYSIGIQGIYRTPSNWLTTATSTLFSTTNEYMDQRTTNRETAEYDINGLKTSFDLGYIFTQGNQRIIPEVGLTHLWQHTDQFTTDNLDNADTTYGGMDEHEIYAHAGMSWYGNYNPGEWQITPMMKIALEQVLTDGELKNTMTAGAASKTVQYTGNDTSLDISAGLEFNYNNYLFSINYDGSYSEDISDNSIILQAMMRF
ncbi:autotransporter domain-containing protein [Desulfosediminicola flagellatus]|uniref:autotransporter domain-containing protein n=1 Tax=Desulfosediminicola flagellatus TaxID=2569541 RepID=UPI00142F152F|nr:autotransporter outer membrane beta-barrel domain-containing protein [Desulfosediminicola flagellatus]